MTRRNHAVLFVFAALCVVGTGVNVTEAAAQSTDSARFQTPSGNINCAVYEDPESDYGSCLVKDSVWKKKAAKPADCDLDWDPTELSVSSQKKGASFVNRTYVGSCRGDIGPLCEPNGCTTLAYGDSIQVGRITCTSQKAGVTCFANKGRKRGFSIARAGYKLIG
jgi:hypothetical protein